MPGKNYVASIRDFWRVCSGVNQTARERATRFLKDVLHTDKFPLTVLDRPIESETAKIVENSYRATILAFLDEWSIFAERNGVDLKKVIEAIKVRPTHSNIIFPGPGIGGYTVVKNGAAVGPIVASAVRTSLGVENVFMVSAALTLAMAVVTLLFYREPAQEMEHRVTSIAATFRNLVKVLGDPKFVSFLLIFSGFWVVFWQQYVSLPIYVRTYVDPNANIDRLLAVEAGTVILYTFAGNYLTRKAPAFLAIIAGVLISSLSWLILTFGGGTPYVVAALIVLALGEVTQAPRYYEYISRLAPPGQQGLFMGYAFLPIGIGYLISGPLAGWLLRYFGEVRQAPHQMWYVIAAAGLVTTLLLVAYSRLVRPMATRSGGA